MKDPRQQMWIQVKEAAARWRPQANPSTDYHNYQEPAPDYGVSHVLLKTLPRHSAMRRPRQTKRRNRRTASPLPEASLRPNHFLYSIRGTNVGENKQLLLMKIWLPLITFICVRVHPRVSMNPSRILSISEFYPPILSSLPFCCLRHLPVREYLRIICVIGVIPRHRLHRPSQVFILSISCLIVRSKYP